MFSIIILLFVGVIFAFLTIGIGKIFGNSSTNPEKGQPYECGIETQGVTWVQFNVGYYLFSLVFLVFDVEIVFLYPWATVLAQLGMTAFIEILIFFGVPILGDYCTHIKRKLLHGCKKKTLSPSFREKCITTKLAKAVFSLPV